MNLSSAVYSFLFFIISQPRSKIQHLLFFFRGTYKSEKSVIYSDIKAIVMIFIYLFINNIICVLCFFVCIEVIGYGKLHRFVQLFLILSIIFKHERAGMIYQAAAGGKSLIRIDPKLIIPVSHTFEFFFYSADITSLKLSRSTAAQQKDQAAYSRDDLCIGFPQIQPLL